MKYLLLICHLPEVVSSTLGTLIFTSETVSTGTVPANDPTTSVSVPKEPLTPQPAESVRVNVPSVAASEPVDEVTTTPKSCNVGVAEAPRADMLSCEMVVVMGPIEAAVAFCSASWKPPIAELLATLDRLTVSADEEEQGSSGMSECVFGTMRRHSAAMLPMDPGTDPMVASGSRVIEFDMETMGIETVQGASPAPKLLGRVPIRLVPEPRASWMTVTDDGTSPWRPLSTT